MTNIIPGPYAKKNSSTSAYVILSRATSLDGILLSHPLTEQCLRINPLPDLINETCRLKLIERNTLISKKYLIKQLIVQVEEIKIRLERKFSDVDRFPNWVKPKLDYFSNLINNLKKLLNIPKQVKTCISCLEICLSDERNPRCFECVKDNIPPLNCKKCLCGKIFSWVKKDGITRNGNKCESCDKHYETTIKHKNSKNWKRKRCLACNNITVSKLSKFCFKCDPRHTSTPKKVNVKIQTDDKITKLNLIKSTIETKNIQSGKNKNDIQLTDKSVETFSIMSKTSLNSDMMKFYEKIDDHVNINSSIEKWNYAKLENPGLNVCFLNSAVQFILSIKPLADILCNKYVKNHCKNTTFLSEFEQFEIFENPNKPISSLPLAKTNFLLEFEKLIVNMTSNPKQTFSAAKLAKVYEVLEPGYTYCNQWDCSSVVDSFFTLYEEFLFLENFGGKNNAQEILKSLKTTTIITVQCKMCNIMKKRENDDFFFICTTEEKY